MPAFLLVGMMWPVAVAEAVLSAAFSCVGYGCNWRPFVRRECNRGRAISLSALPPGGSGR